MMADDWNAKAQRRMWEIEMISVVLRRAVKPPSRGSHCFTLALGLLAVLGIQASSLAQTAFPNKPIKFIVAVGAGGATDTSARRIADRLARVLGQSVVVENQPSASGIIAAQATMRSVPDGHTILIGTNTSHAGNKSLFKNLPYDPVSDFTRIGLAGLTLTINPSLPFKSVSELVTYAKANPEKLTFGSGTGSARFAAELFNLKAGIKMLSVPYKSNNEAMADLLGGHISLMFGDTTLMSSQIQAGKLRGLAVSSATRSKLSPDLPTIQEAGVQGYELVGWIAMFAPAQTPEAIIARLNAEVRKILTDAEFAAGLTAVGIEPAPTTPDELRAFVVSETAKWAEIAKSAGIEAQ